jgi:hypothetical protein
MPWIRERKFFSAKFVYEGDVMKGYEVVFHPNPYPFRGQPYRYDRPFDGAAEEDWDVLNP